MRKKHRVGIVGVCHVHVHNVAAVFQRHPRVELVACADTTPRVAERREAPYTRAWNRDYLVKRLGIPKAYDDYRQMLDKEKLDIVICNSENSKHPEPIVYGTEGTLVVDERRERPAVEVLKGRGQTSSYEGVALAANRQTVAEEFVHHLETGAPLHPTLDLRFNVEATAVLDAGVRSAASGRLELVSGPAWEIGRTSPI